MSLSDSRKAFDKGLGRYLPVLLRMCRQCSPGCANLVGSEICWGATKAIISTPSTIRLCPPFFAPKT